MDTKFPSLRPAPRQGEFGSLKPALCEYILIWFVFSKLHKGFPLP